MSKHARLAPMSFPIEVDGVVHNWPTEFVGPRCVEIWEPLSTKAPNPNLTLPFCCYANTVIFYVRPYTLRDHNHFFRWPDGWHKEAPGDGYEEWGRVDTLIQWADVSVLGSKLEVCGGTVYWQHKRWWMQHHMRIRKEDRDV